ncbi:hypothetical protein OE88DRAFT_1625305 [Heliocybe sulcata]|uniref:Fe2OG dioxygenase domain-containing protein n=1 Tax=Heliocybe sulcata TaxID=5364 RepID=A0A5C3N9X7_9AGAM|nr:hypothetical protein OE88DRAFT_1625305 [Heliocybe sulcata]
MTETLGPSGAPSTPLLEPCHVRRVRPPLPCKPPVWAKHRQEVCESVEWFRSYQGGVYYNRGGAHGYLLSAFSASRDLFHHEGKLIISHGGGRAEAIHSREGKLMAYQAADQQADDKSVRALLSSYEQHRPIVLLIDDKYELFPYDLKASNPDYTYVALGNYLITQVWAERSSPKASMDSVIRYKFAFQWCDEQGEPWWLQNPPKHDSFGHSGLSIGDTGPDTNSGDPLRPDIGTDKLSAGITIRSCQCCRRPSPLIYIQGWTCLSPDCPQFWCLADGKTPPEDLDYEKAFLVLLDLPIANCMDIRPLLPRNPGVEGVTTGQEFTRGFHCPKCGRLSCRAKWEYWECFSCGNRYRVEGRIRLPNELWKRMKLGFDQHKVRPGAGGSCDAVVVTVVCTELFRNNQTVFRPTFILPGGRGRIHHVLGGPLRNKRADDIFRLYQEQAAEGQVSFRRWPIRMVSRGDLLAQYFSHNGEWPYVGGTNETISFDKAPSAVMQALSLIQDRASHVLDRRLTFNEILSAAYMQDQQMAYHGDDEEGLGPIVASLSLGSPALMRFRPKQGKQEVISIILRHGDVIVMEGLEVQQYYEHQVQPVDFRIAATARMIGMEGT